ncbi:allatostatin-A [Drosophila navojoa]|uniref:allatostatin-A n=1 Tax=Drosophila navojoa TaxID=7232 RepID=UPI0011BFB4AC|nr:allatostatin-A [Drosophila navojoa]
MNMLHTQLLFLALCCLGYVCCTPVIGQDEARNHVSSVNDGDNDMLLNAGEDVQEAGGDIDKRMERYAFGLGRRAYMYNNGGPGMKRLPVYNFGLGKRSRPYSFGLGKRSDYEDEQDNEIDYRALPPGFMAALGRGGSRQNKRTTRPQPFNFGLGRR